MTLVVLLMAGTLNAKADEAKPKGRLRILVPEEAFVFVAKQKLTSTGTERLVESPPLRAGGRYSYEVSVIHEGREVVREVRFVAGRTVEVDFRPDFAKVTAAPANPFKPIRPEWLPKRVYRA
jgi:uncharacterized protein (TIGR03000 family)